MGGRGRSWRAVAVTAAAVQRPPVQSSFPPRALPPSPPVSLMRPTMKSTSSSADCSGTGCAGAAPAVGSAVGLSRLALCSGGRAAVWRFAANRACLGAPLSLPGRALGPSWARGRTQATQAAIVDRDGNRVVNVSWESARQAVLFGCLVGAHQGAIAWSLHCPSRTCMIFSAVCGSLEASQTSRQGCRATAQRRLGAGTACSSRNACAGASRQAGGSG